MYVLVELYIENEDIEGWAADNAPYSEITDHVLIEQFLYDTEGLHSTVNAIL